MNPVGGAPISSGLVARRGPDEVDSGRGVREVDLEERAAAEEDLAVAPRGAFGIARRLGVMIERDGREFLGEFAGRLFILEQSQPAA